MLVPCLQRLHAHAATTARKLMQQKLLNVQNVTRAQNAAQTQLLAALIRQHAATLQHVLHAKRLTLAARPSNEKSIRKADSYAGRYCSQSNSIFFLCLCLMLLFRRREAALIPRNVCSRRIPGNGTSAFQELSGSSSGNGVWSAGHRIYRNLRSYPVR